MAGSTMGRIGRLWAFLLALAFCSGPAAAQVPAPGLSAFTSNAELRAFLKTQRGVQHDVMPAMAMAPPPPPPPPPPSMPAPSEPASAVMTKQSAHSAVNEVIVTGARADSPSITNNQIANVDEGGIVKVHGDNLVILRRGRLFTVSTAGGALTAIDAINAFPPGIDGEEAWYDEMLVSQNRVIVIGYSYGGGGTEINRFRISAAGKLTYEDTHHLTSNDYYSSRNYASRLIGDTLIFYTPLYLEWENDPLEALPSMRRWQGRAGRAFKRIVDARQVYIAPALRKSGEEVDTLHTVTQCDMAAAVMTCKATAVLGQESRSFYVSGEAIYLWVSEYWREAEGSPEASVYRIPLDGSRPQAIQARGTPLDQFSFHEDTARGFLNVAVLSQGGGDAMWRPEFAEGDMALLRLPLASFGDGSAEASRWDYRMLPQIPDVSRNRFVGDHFIYAGGRYLEAMAEGSGSVGVANLETQETSTFGVAQPVSRIEALGRDALVVGTNKDLIFTTIALDGQPRLSDTFAVAGGSEGESRSHGFFFRSDSADGAAGVLGLAMRRPSDSAVDMLFLRRSARRLGLLGDLRASGGRQIDDGCVASCVDWYGNARPIFLRGRVFALLGYELVEGREQGGGITEVGRTNFAPPKR